MAIIEDRIVKAYLNVNHQVPEGTRRAGSCVFRLNTNTKRIKERHKVNVTAGGLFYIMKTYKGGWKRRVESLGGPGHWLVAKEIQGPGSLMASRDVRYAYPSWEYVTLQGPVARVRKVNRGSLDVFPPLPYKGGDALTILRNPKSRVKVEIKSDRMWNECFLRDREICLHHGGVLTANRRPGWAALKRSTLAEGWTACRIAVEVISRERVELIEIKMKSSENETVVVLPTPSCAQCASHNEGQIKIDHSKIRYETNERDVVDEDEEKLRRDERCKSLEREETVIQLLGEDKPQCKTYWGFKGRHSLLIPAADLELPIC
ncbi:hypothetical protein DFH28DRAFT_1111800 [Melampsora americana]|nr:hypothetical protein DFH28DRAFT_1111800 [Melampsora americana]